MKTIDKETHSPFIIKLIRPNTNTAITTIKWIQTKTRSKKKDQVGKILNLSQKTFQIKVFEILTDLSADFGSWKCLFKPASKSDLKEFEGYMTQLEQIPLESKLKE